MRGAGDSMAPHRRTASAVGDPGNHGCPEHEMARWASPGDRRRLGRPIRIRRTRDVEDSSVTSTVGTTSFARAAWSILIAGLVGACGASTTPPSPPPSEPHTGFAPLELKVIGGPDWLVATAGSLWVKRDDGHVNRIDPETGDVQAEIVTRVTSTDGCNGLGVSADAVWTCSASGPRPDRSRNERGDRDDPHRQGLLAGSTRGGGRPDLGPLRKRRPARRRGHDRQHPGRPGRAARAVFGPRGGG